MNDALIQTFALTFGFPYTQTRQELPPLEGGRHLHLGVWLVQKSQTISVDRRLARRMGGVWRNV